MTGFRRRRRILDTYSTVSCGDLDPILFSAVRPTCAPDRHKRFLWLFPLPSGCGKSVCSFVYYHILEVNQASRGDVAENLQNG